MEQLGFVRKVNHDQAEVEVRRISGCGGECSSCGGCDAPKVVVYLKNNIGAKEGDLVEIKAIPKRILKYTLIAYMIPFAMLVIGILGGINYFQSIGVENYEIYGFFVGIAFLGISYIIVKIIDKYIAKKDEVAMEMTRILK